jgi:hypothetical protein
MLKGGAFRCTRSTVAKGSKTLSNTCPGTRSSGSPGAMAITPDPDKREAESVNFLYLIDECKHKSTFVFHYFAGTCFL